MTETGNILDITSENFQQVVVEQSMQSLVALLFWAPSVPESAAMAATLESVAAEYGADMLLAKVNCEVEQMLPAQLGVQALPTLILIKQGRQLDGASGPQPDEQVRSMLHKHLPQEHDKLFAQAQPLLAEGNAADAYPVLKSAHQMAPERVDISMSLCSAMIPLAKLDEAEALLNTIPLADQNADYQALLSQLELKRQAADTPEIQALEQAYQAEPDNLELRLKLAVQYHEVGRSEEALDNLFGILTKQLDFADGQARATFLDILKALPAGDTLSSRYRQKFYSLLY